MGTQYTSAGRSLSISRSSAAGFMPCASTSTAPMRAMRLLSTPITPLYVGASVSTRAPSSTSTRVTRSTAWRKPFTIINSLPSVFMPFWRMSAMRYCLSGS